jgi:hypothetical protein
MTIITPLSAANTILAADPVAELNQQAINAVETVAFEQLVSAATLVATAFRLRDEQGLISALRQLVLAVRPFQA